MSCSRKGAIARIGEISRKFKASVGAIYGNFLPISPSKVFIQKVSL